MTWACEECGWEWPYRGEEAWAWAECDSCGGRLVEQEDRIEQLRGRGADRGRRGELAVPVLHPGQLMTRYLRQSTTARSSGAVVELYDTEDPLSVFDPEGGRWVTICSHGLLVNHETLATARLFASAPETWCEECAEAAEARV